MGDDGFLKRLNVQVRGHNVVGDATWCRGEGVRTEIVDGEGQVECSVRCVNQHERISALGAAIVVLPRKTA